MSLPAVPTPPRDAVVPQFVVPRFVVPQFAVRAAVTVVGCAAFALLPWRYALLAVALAALGMLAPASLAGWGAALVIGLGQLAHPALLGDWRVYAAVAVVHALHVLAGWTLVLPARGMLRPRALRSTLRRWIVVDASAQVVLAAALALQRLPLRDAVPVGVSVPAAAACMIVVVVVLRRLRSRR